MSLDSMTDPGGGGATASEEGEHLPSDLLMGLFQSSSDSSEHDHDIPKTDELFFQALTVNHSALADTVSLLCQNLTADASGNVTGGGGGGGINCNTAGGGGSDYDDGNLTGLVHHRGPPPIDYLKVYVLSTMTILTIVGNASVVLSILLRR